MLEHNNNNGNNNNNSNNNNNKRLQSLECYMDKAGFCLYQMLINQVHLKLHW